MKLAHFSDWHFESAPGDFGERLGVFLRLVERALRLGAGHVVLTGDMTERTLAVDHRRLLRELAALGVRGPRRLSLVPGNHELHPLAAGRRAASAQTVAANRRWFYRLAAPTTTAAQRLSRRGPFPFVKRLAGGAVLLVGLDTVHDHPDRGSRGRFGEDDRRALEAALAFPRHRRAQVRILAMHHYPIHPVIFGPGLSGDFEPADRRRIRAFIRSQGFDFVLCGHKHHGARVRALGATLIVNSATGSGFHLIDAARGGVRWIR